MNASHGGPVGGSDLVDTGAGPNAKQGVRVDSLRCAAGAEGLVLRFETQHLRAQLGIAGLEIGNGSKQILNGAADARHGSELLIQSSRRLGSTVI
jgi:hypothetical protein